MVDYYRWQLKKVMRKLAHCRDLTVLLQKLTQFQAESANGRLLDALVDHYQEQKITADVELRHFMGKPKRQRFWEEYQQFVQARGKGAILAENPFHPTKVKHVAPYSSRNKLRLCGRMKKEPSMHHWPSCTISVFA